MSRSAWVMTLLAFCMGLMTWTFSSAEHPILREVAIGLSVLLFVSAGIMAVWPRLRDLRNWLASRYEFAWPIKLKRNGSVTIPRRRSDGEIAFKNLLEHVARDNWPKKDERLYSPLTCRDVVDTYRRHRFKSEAEQELKRHIGKWMRHEGTFSDRDLEGRRLIFRAPVGKATVFAWFDQEWVNRTSILKADTDVKIEGLISEITDAYIELKHSELVD